MFQNHHPGKLLGFANMDSVATKVLAKELWDSLEVQHKVLDLL
jgi:hypothetical protein